MDRVTRGGGGGEVSTTGTPATWQLSPSAKVEGTHHEGEQDLGNFTQESCVGVAKV
jgi:hypothetical protein